MIKIKQHKTVKEAQRVRISDRTMTTLKNGNLVPTPLCMYRQLTKSMRHG